MVVFQDLLWWKDYNLSRASKHKIRNLCSQLGLNYMMLNYSYTYYSDRQTWLCRSIRNHAKEPCSFSKDYQLSKLAYTVSDTRPTDFLSPLISYSLLKYIKCINSNLS